MELAIMDIGKLLTCMLFAMVAGASCVPQPVHIPVTNVSLSNGKIARGVAVSVGQPEESFAFMPLWPNNNTFLYGTNGFCVLDGADTWSTQACTTFRGGAYDSTSSKSAMAASVGSYPIDKEGPAMRFVTDWLALNENTSIVDFPMGVALNDWGEQAYTPMMSIGLGENSTLLNALKAAGHIASRTFGFYMGQRGSSVNQPLDGGLVIGGYDKAKTADTGFVGDMSPVSDSCPTGLMVNVSDLVLNFVNGSTASILGSSDEDSFGACINPSTPTVMRLSNPYLMNFLRLAGNEYKNMDHTLGLWYYNLRYGKGEHPFDGDLTVKFTSGLSVRIPNYLLVVPDTFIGRQTGDIDVNYTSSVLALYPNQGVSTDDLAQFGSQFLAAAYLMVNQDAGKFTLWPANPTTKMDLVAVDETGTNVTNTCAAETPGVVNGGGVHPLSPEGSSGFSSPSLQTPPSSPVNSTLSPAAIGGIVGGAFGLLLLVFGIWLLATRRKRHLSALQSPNPVALEGLDPSGPDNTGNKKEENPGAAELASGSGTREIDPMLNVQEIGGQPIAAVRPLPDNRPRDFAYELSA